MVQHAELRARCFWSVRFSTLLEWLHLQVQVVLFHFGFWFSYRRYYCSEPKHHRHNYLQNSQLQYLRLCFFCQHFLGLFFLLVICGHFRYFYFYRWGNLYHHNYRKNPYYHRFRLIFSFFIIFFLFFNIFLKFNYFIAFFILNKICWYIFSQILIINSKRI